MQDAAGNDAATLETAIVNNRSTVAANPKLSFNIQQIGTDELEGARKDRFGHSVSASRDGKIVAIGAPQDGIGNGYVQVYKQVGNSWKTLGNKLTGPARNDRFGEE